MQGHLYLEHIFDVLLREALPNPEAIELKRMGFAQRIDLVLALDLLPQELVETVRALGRLRNRSAHDLDFEITDKEVADLRNITPKPLRDAVQAEEGRPPSPLSFFEIIYALAIQVDVIRQEHAASRDLSRKAQIRCPIPDDHIDPRRRALFVARSILGEVRDGERAC